MLKSIVYDRENKITKYTKYKPKPKEGRHLVKYKEEKDYNYYKCDYCNEEIKILDKKYEMTGGIVTFPDSLTRKGQLKLVLCNKCLKPVLKEFEDEFQVEVLKK